MAKFQLQVHPAIRIICIPWHWWLTCNCKVVLSWFLTLCDKQTQKCKCGTGQITLASCNGTASPLNRHVLATYFDIHEQHYTNEYDIQKNNNEISLWIVILLTISTGLPRKAVEVRRPQNQSIRVIYISKTTVKTRRIQRSSQHSDWSIVQDNQLTT